MKVVITYRAIFIGGVSYKEGDVVDVPNAVLPDLLGMKRGRLYDPLIDELPPEPEPAPKQDQDDPPVSKKGRKE